MAEKVERHSREFGTGDPHKRGIQTEVVLES
jgi:hypothetical protein